MDSGGLGFRGTVLAGLVVAIVAPAILAGASWVFNFHHQAWLIVLAVSQWIGSVLAYSVPVPIVLLVIFAGFALYVGRGAVLRKREAQAERAVASTAWPADSRAVVKAEPAPPTDNEIAVLRLLARADGKWMGVMELARRAALANLITEQALDRLRDRGFLKWSAGMGVLSYRLSPEGRDYAIANGYVPPPPTVSERRALR